MGLGFWFGDGIPIAGMSVADTVGQVWGKRSLGLWHLVTGLWLMYLTFATGLNFSLGWTLPL